MQLFSYVVARDYGFAPNPFFNVCTLATCKPGIRRVAQVGDWVVGTGTASRKRRSYLVFAMKVDEAMTFNEYWNDPRFLQKQPNLRGSKKQAFGDNIYHRPSPNAPWKQSNSHHSFVDGSPNPANISNDTQANRILIGSDYVYWGGSGPRIPTKFRNYDGVDICAGRGYKSKDRCPIHDKSDAPQRRANILKGTLNAATHIELDAIWIGRDLGYRGGRRTGLALTDDVHIAAHAERWRLPYERPTKGQPLAERTAAVIWSILQEIDAPVFLWNVFPLHPHEPDDPFTNRAHNARERAAGEDILASLIGLLAPRRIVAIGNDAAQSAARIAPEKPVIQVRHPSYGGQTEFLGQIRSIYRCHSLSLF